MVLVGYGRVGKRIAAILGEKKIPCVVADTNREIVEQLRAKNIPERTTTRQRHGRTCFTSDGEITYRIPLPLNT